MIIKIPAIPPLSKTSDYLQRRDEFDAKARAATDGLVAPARCSVSVEISQRRRVGRLDSRVRVVLKSLARVGFLKENRVDVLRCGFGRHGRDQTKVRINEH